MAQPGSFTDKIRLYLRKNQTHSLHKSKRKKFPRRRIITYFPGQILQTDLIDMQKFSTQNSGFNYILVVIDCFSKFLWCAPIKNKTAVLTADGLKIIFSKMKFIVQTLIFDEGLEFVNFSVKNLLKERGIHSYHILSNTKAGAAERVNKTIKQTIWKLFTKNNNSKWVDKIDDIVINYNNTYHSTIKMAPSKVTWENRKLVFKNSYPNKKFTNNCRLKRGDRVRVALKKYLFEKAFTQNWSKEIFTIIRVFKKFGVSWYRIRDDNGIIYSKQKYFYELNQV